MKKLLFALMVLCALPLSALGAKNTQAGSTDVTIADNPDDLKARDIQFEQLDVEKGTAMVSFILHSSVQTIHQKFTFCHLLSSVIA